MTQTVEQVWDAATIRGAVAGLGRRITDEIGAEDPLVVSLLTGSVIFLADLIRAIESPLRFEFIQVAYAPAHGEPAVLEIHFPLPLDLAGQSVLLVKDVVSSGVIETYLASQLRGHGARAVRLAALIDVPDERKTDFVADYSAFSTDLPGIFVGYGLKHAGRYGNLPWIGRLPESGPR